MPEHERGKGPVLAVNAAESRVQLVLAAGGEVLDHMDAPAAGQANAHMAPALDGMLRAQGLGVAGLCGVACVRGPGSFTGLRMSVAFCLGLARGANLPMAGLDYLPLLAAGPAQTAQPRFTGLLAVWVRSRRGQVYAQHFTSPGPTPRNAARAMTLDDAARALAREAETMTGAISGTGLDAVAAVIGSGALMPGAAEALTGAGLGRFVNGEDIPGAPPGNAWTDPLPPVLARAACLAVYGPEPPEPAYLRLSDAEQNLADIARARGLDPDEAAQRLARATSGHGEPTS